MKAPDEKPDCKLTGRDGNAWAIMGRVGKALRRAGADAEYIEKYVAEATAGDYNDLLTVSMKYVNAS